MPENLGVKHYDASTLDASYSNALDLKDVIAIDECLVGRHPDHDPKMWQFILDTLARNKSEGIDTSSPIINPLDIKIIEHMGLNLPTAIMLILSVSRLSQGPAEINIYSHNGTSKATLVKHMIGQNPPQSLITVDQYHIGKDLVWNGYVLHFEDIPETIIEALPGKKFREFLSHPVLDQFDMTIERVVSPINKHIATDYKTISDSCVRVADLANAALLKNKPKRRFRFGETKHIPT